MSLLFDVIDNKTEMLAEKIFERQFGYDKNLDNEYVDYRKTKMYRDIKHNLKSLEVAVQYDANKIFEDYAFWLVKLLSTRMEDLPKERIKEQMISHYRIIGEVLEEAQVKRDYQQKAQLHLENIYLEIFQKTMIKVGELWHSGTIKVDEEHYITSMIQNIMMQLWPKIFAKEKIDRTILVCTVGNELHEMGARILCDLMAIRGWDSIYLGAAIPVDNIISAVKKHDPDLVGLSVTMPFYLEQCERAVKKIKTNDSTKDVKIAVGGRAFSLAPHLPAEWGADVTATNGIELAEWAEKNI